MCTHWQVSKSIKTYENIENLTAGVLTLVTSITVSRADEKKQTIYNHIATRIALHTPLYHFRAVLRFVVQGAAGLQHFGDHCWHRGLYLHPHLP